MATHSSAKVVRVRPGFARPAAFYNGVVLTIGAFDGVHIGHHRVINKLLGKAVELNLPSAVMTFHPDPADFFRPDKPQASLMCWREKVEALLAIGIDYVITVPFNKALSQISAESFVNDLLIDQLGIKFLMVGDDFKFGAKRQGDFALLQRMASEIGFDVDRSETHEMQGQRISSTRIRSLLADGNFDAAKHLLGKPYSIAGKVVEGKKLGRAIGFPTANINLKRKRSALSGVYTVRMKIENGDSYAGVANIGVRPAVNSLEFPLLEVHLFDFDADIYGANVTVYFEHWLRPEMNFNSLEDLSQAIAKDVAAAQGWFASLSHHYR